METSLKCDVRSMETSLEVPVRSKQIGLENHCLTSFLSQCFIRPKSVWKIFKGKATFYPDVYETFKENSFEDRDQSCWPPDQENVSREITRSARYAARTNFDSESISCHMLFAWHVFKMKMYSNRFLPLKRQTPVLLRKRISPVVDLPIIQCGNVYSFLRHN